MDAKEINSTQPRDSVIVPPFEREWTVEAFLRSAAAQTFTDFEILDVDDGSRDSGPAIVRAFPDPRIRLIHQENAGLGAARNRGIAEARGGLLAFLHAGGQWMPDYTERAIRYMDAEPEIAAITFTWVDQPIGVSCVPALQRHVLVGGIQPISATPAPSVMVAMIILMWQATTVLRSYGGFDYKVARHSEDGHLFVKVLLNESACSGRQPAAHFCGNRRATRPLEPFLTEPDDLRRVCLEHLRDLLDGFLCMRALNASCALAGRLARRRKGTP